MRNKFGDRLKDLIKENNINQKTFALAIGVSQATVSDWINNKQQPTAENIYLTAEYFNVCADYLIGRKNWY